MFGGKLRCPVCNQYAPDRCTCNKSSIMVKKIVETLGKYRIDVSTEKATQAAISQVLLESNLAHEREYILDDGRGSLIDFFIRERRLQGATVGMEQGIGIEVKIDGGAHDIYRQLERYCKTGKLAAILLVTNRAMGLPKEIAGVPAYYFALGRQWL